jgi:hypothetical protein
MRAFLVAHKDLPTLHELLSIAAKSYASECGGTSYSIADTAIFYWARGLKSIESKVGNDVSWREAA